MSEPASSIISLSAVLPGQFFCGWNVATFCPTKKKVAQFAQELFFSLLTGGGASLSLSLLNHGVLVVSVNDMVYGMETAGAIQLLYTSLEAIRTNCCQTGSFVCCKTQSDQSRMLKNGILQVGIGVLSVVWIQGIIDQESLAFDCVGVGGGIGLLFGLFSAALDCLKKKCDKQKCDKQKYDQSPRLLSGQMPIAPLSGRGDWSDESYNSYTSQDSQGQNSCTTMTWKESAKRVGLGLLIGATADIFNSRRQNNSWEESLDHMKYGVTTAGVTSLWVVICLMIRARCYKRYFFNYRVEKSCNQIEEIFLYVLVGALSCLETQVASHQEHLVFDPLIIGMITGLVFGILSVLVYRLKHRCCVSDAIPFFQNRASTLSNQDTPIASPVRYVRISTNHRPQKHDDDWWDKPVSF